VKDVAMVKPWKCAVLAACVGSVAVSRADPLDQQGNALPRGAIARLGSTRLRPAGNHLAFTPDSRLLATVHQGEVSIFDMRDGKVVQQWRRNHMSADGVAFSPDGKFLFAGAGSTAYPYDDHAPGLWDWRTGRLVRRFQVPAREGGKELGEMALSPNGKRLVLRHIERQQNKIVASTFSLRNVKDDRVLQTWRGSVFAFSAKDQLAALGSDRQILLVDLRTGKTVRTLKQGAAEMTSLAFTHDGKTLAALAPSLTFWDVATGQRLDDFLPIENYSTHLEFCLASRHPWIATHDRGGTVHVWDIPARKRITQFDSPAHLAAFSPDDLTLVMRQELLFRLFDTRTWKERCRYDGHDTWLQQAVYSPDGRRVATSAGPHVLLWETATGKLLLHRDFSEDYLGSVRNIKWSPDGRTITSTDRHLRFWDTGTGKDLAKLSFQLTHRDYYFHPRLGHVMIFFPQRSDILRQDFVEWDPRADKELSRHHLGNLQPMALSPDGERTVLEDGFFNLQIWDGKELRKIEHPRPSWRLFAALGDRQVATSEAGREGGTIRLWDSHTGKGLWKSNAAHADGPRRYQFSPDGNFLYLSGWSPPQALRTTDGRLARKYRLNDFQWVSDCRLSPDGRLLVCLVAESKDMVKMELVSLEAVTGSVRRRFIIPPSVPSWTIGLEAIAPDSTTLLTCGPGLSAVVWDLAGLEEARRLGRPKPKELDRLWHDLAGADAEKAHRAMALFVVGAKPARDFLPRRLQLAQPVDGKGVEQLISQLLDDDARFREKARQALRGLDRQAEPTLRKALEGAPPKELRVILEQLLDDMDGLLGPGPLLQQVRAVEVLERLEASAVLDELARGDPTSRLTQESRAAFIRLKKQ
jgi:WD40 repeat protein